MSEIPQGLPPQALQNIWSTAESWDQMTWMWDWDHMISPARVLRQYLFEHGTVPFWNLYLCGGQFELQNPQSFTFTWPSLLYYLIHPAAAIMVLWALLTAAGTWATARLLQYAGTRHWVSWTCAVAFTFSGYFGAHFNQGHATFSFFHMVPLLCWAVTREWHRHMESRRPRLIVPWLFLLTFLLFSAPAIQAMVYSFPAFLILTLFLIWPAATGFASGLAVSLTLGVLVASYKFLPVLFQSFSRHREDIFTERYGPDILLKTMFTFVSQPARMWQDYHFPERFFGWWEYAAFISPVLMILALLMPVVYFASRTLQSMRFHEKPTPDIRPTTIFRHRLLIAGVVMMLAGMVLCLGNGFWLDVAKSGSFGSALSGPVARLLQSIRVFPRFQFLSLFGATICAGIGLEYILSSRAFLNAVPTSALIMRVTMMLLVAGPSLVQSAVMIHSINAIPDRIMVERFGLKESLDVMAHDKSLFLSNRVLLMPGILSAQDMMVRRGAVVSECYDPFFPVKPDFQRRIASVLRPATSPAAARLENVTTRSFDLVVPSALTQNLLLNLPLVMEAKVTPEPFIGRGGMEFDRAAVAGRAIHVEFPLDDAIFGGFVSVIAIITAAGMWLKEKEKKLLNADPST